MKRHLLYIAAALVMVANLALLPVLASALSTAGPDKKNEFGGADVTYYLANSKDVKGADSMDVPIYTTPGAAKPKTDIKVTYWCDSRDANVVMTSPQSINVCTGKNVISGKSFTIPASSFGGPITIGSSKQVYRAVLHFEMRGDYGTRRGFKLTAPDGFIIGYSTANSDYFAIINQSRCDQTDYANDLGKTSTEGCDRWYTYRIPFAAPCTAPAGAAKITFFDLDNVAGRSRGNPQYKHEMKAKVQDMDDASDAQNINISGGGNGTLIERHVNLKKAHRYYLIVEGVYSNNVLQFHLPYDSINSLVRCPDDPDPDNWRIDGATIGTGNYVVPGQRINWTHTLSKSGTGKPKTDVTYRVMRNSNGGPYAEVASGQVSVPASKNQTIILRKNSSYPTTPADVGKEFCEFIKWSPTSYNYSGTTQSSPYCVKVGVSPVVHILGNEARVGSSFGGGTLNVNSKIMGSTSTYNASGVEYGVLAPQAITSFPSNSGAFTSQTTKNTLTFANTDSICGNGCFSTPSALGALPNVATVPNEWNGNGVVVCDFGNTSVKLSGIAAGACNGVSYDLNNFDGSLIVKTTGEIEIDRDVKYTKGVLSNVDKMPQLVLYGEHAIRVNPEITHVDAWLVSKWKVDMCNGPADTGLRLNDDCRRQLSVNGPIIAQLLALKRTAYDTENSEKPAEEIHLRGDAYVWAHNVTSRNGSWKTTGLTELPPRY